jgi:putative phosphoribosyl transferase
MALQFRDRSEAGRILAGRLGTYAGRTDVIVLALPRGGVPVAFAVAQALHAPLDVFLVRKLGVPGHEELAMGAIASGGVLVLNHDVVRELGIPNHALELVAAREQQELTRRERLYRDDRPPSVVRDRTVILVDDGMATGSTMRAAVNALKQQAARIVVAVPVAAAPTCDEFRTEVDEVVCILTPEPFWAVGLWYEDFSPTTDDEVRDLLALAARRTPAEAGHVHRRGHEPSSAT